MSDSLKMAAFDIETAPGIYYSFSVYDTSISSDKVIEYPRIIAFSAQWKDSKKVVFFSEYHNGREAMLDALWELFNEADVLVSYNGDKFDIPWVEGELLEAGYSPPSPSMKIDLYKVIKRVTRWPHKNLNTAAARLLGDQKIAHPGFSLWRDCLMGDDEAKRKAWALMKRYAIKDTKLLWPLFEKLKGRIKMPHPVTDNPTACHNCGSERLQRRGVRRTLYSTYPRYQCQDCGAWFRGISRHSSTDIRAAL